MLKDFEFLGIGLRNYPQDLLGKFSGRLIVAAGAKCVWDDLLRLGVRGGADNNGYDVMTVNDMTAYYPGRIKHVYSNDHRMLPHWIAARRPQYVRAYGPIGYVHTCRAGAKYSWPWPGHGTSALGAVYTGLAMGYGEIVVCGAPLDDTPNFFSPDWETRNFTREVPVKDNGTMAYWHKAAKQCFRGRVKGMSGRTSELLGSP